MYKCKSRRGQAAVADKERTERGKLRLEEPGCHEAAGSGFLVRISVGRRNLMDFLLGLGCK